MKCTKVNIKQNHDVYIGRPTKWGNPFSAKKESLAEFTALNRKDSIEKHKEWFLQNETLLNDLHELKGKILGCWCSEGQSCHGDIIVEMVNSLNNELF